MAKVLARPNDLTPELSENSDVRGSLPSVGQRLAVLCWLSMCVAFWIEIARLIF